MADRSCSSLEITLRGRFEYQKPKIILNVRRARQYVAFVTKDEWNPESQGSKFPLIFASYRLHWALGYLIPQNFLWNKKMISILV